MPPTTTNSRSLLDISDDMAALDELLLESGGDVSDPTVADYVDAWLSEIEHDLNGKVDRYCALIQQKTLTAAMRKEEAERLIKGSKADADAASYLKNKLKMVMESRGLKKAGAVRTASVCGNGGKAPLEIDDGVKPEDVAARFTRATVTMSGEMFHQVHAIGELGVRLEDVQAKRNPRTGAYHPFDLMKADVRFEFDTDAIRAALEAGEELSWARIADRGSHLRVK